MADDAALYRRSRLIHEANQGGENITLEQAKAIAHWDAFGAVGRPPRTRVTAFQYEIKPFKMPRRAAWSLPIPANKFGKLLNGFSPKAMDDKWFIYADGLDADGNAFLNMCYTSKWEEMIKLDIKTTGDREDETQAWNAEITAITWETAEDRVRRASEDMAKYEALEVCNWILGVKLVEEIKEPPEWDSLPTIYPKIGPTTLYMGTMLSKKTIESLTPGAIITIDKLVRTWEK